MLLGVGKHLNDDGALCLMDVKEAVPAIAPYLGNLPQDDAVRVVTGARHLSPALGERMIAGRLLDKPVFLRELLPEDLKLEIPQLTREEATKAARYLAIVVGEAHAWQMDHSTRQEWRKRLARDRVSGLDAPSWLWSSVVELVANHEAALFGALPQICPRSPAQYAVPPRARRGVARLHRRCRAPQGLAFAHSSLSDEVPRREGAGLRWPEWSNGDTRKAFALRPGPRKSLCRRLCPTLAIDVIPESIRSLRTSPVAVAGSHTPISEN